MLCRQVHSGLGMRLASILLVAQVIGLVTAVTARAIEPPNPQELVQVELVAETASVASAATLWVDVHFTIKPGWHIYWRNPGDSGLPTAIEWHLPPGFSAGSILWPVPERFVQGGIGNYGYAGSAHLLVPITAAKDLAAGPAVAARFANIRRELPLPAPFEARFTADAHAYFLRVPERALVRLHDPTG